MKDYTMMAEKIFPKADRKHQDWWRNDADGREFIKETIAKLEGDLDV